MKTDKTIQIITKLKKKAKKLYLQFFKEGRYLQKGVNCRYKWFGNDYSGFYVCPDFLNNDSIVYSVGIGEDISFCKSLIDRFQCTVYGFDPTPKSIDWIYKQKAPVGFHFFDYGIATVTGLIKFNLPKNSDYVSGSIVEQSNVSSDNYIHVKMKTFPDIANELGHKNINVLKLDIEGAEYDVLDDVLDSGVGIDQILIEFHERYITNGKDKTISAIRKLQSKGYEIFAISDTYEEVSFIRKNLFEKCSNN